MGRKITKTAVDNLSPGPRNAFLWGTEITGFGCKITPTGRKVYILQNRTEGEVREGSAAPLPESSYGQRSLQSELVFEYSFQQSIRSSMAAFKSASVPGSPSLNEQASSTQSRAYSGDLGCG